MRLMELRCEASGSDVMPHLPRQPHHCPENHSSHCIEAVGKKCIYLEIAEMPVVRSSDSVWLLFKMPWITRQVVPEKCLQLRSNLVGDTKSLR